MESRILPICISFEEGTVYPEKAGWNALKDPAGVQLGGVLGTAGLVRLSRSLQSNVSFKVANPRIAECFCLIGLVPAFKFPCPIPRLAGSSFSKLE